jgi:DNA replication and repair protein RecF
MRPITATYMSESSSGPLTATDADTLEDQLREALARRRRAEIDRGLTLVGPHRDELHLMIDGLDARYQASQGEQRTLALALRLAGHVVVRELTGAAPVLLLDDVFSELDAQRAAALVRNLPPGQTLLTTAGALPPDVVAQQNLVVRAGRIEALSP